MGYARTYSGMWLCSLTAEQRERTCSYWYTVTTYGATPHTAFRTKAALLRWLDLTGLSVDDNIPEHGTGGSFRIKGEYREEMLLHDAASFYSLEGVRTRAMSNGDYVDAIVTTDPYDGLRTIHTLNPNVKNRRVYNHQESREREDSGLVEA